MCEHNRLKCTDNVFYCIDCGAVVKQKPAAKPKPPKESAPEPEKKRQPQKTKAS